MRVLLVSDLDPVRVIGGGERLLAGHAEGLAARGHEVLVCSGAPGPGTVLGAVPVRRVGRSPATPLHLDAVVRTFRPDVVVGYQPACALGALRAARRRGIPTVYVFSSSWPAEYATRRPRPRRTGLLLRRGLERACLRASDRVVVLSSYSAAQVRAAHPGVAGEVRVVPGGVNTVRFSPDGGPDPARARLGIPGGRPLLLAVRNLVPRMGLDNLLDAMPTVIRALPEARLIIAGDGPLREDLQAHARRLGLGERVRFVGFVPEDRLPDHYRAADLVVMPSRALEGFGLTTVEALACGTPVVGTPVGATPEILTPLDPCLVTDDATAEAIAAGILRVVGSLPGDLRERARAHVLARYRWEAVAEDLEAVFREVLR